jgi:hypothetical protein
MRSGTLTQVAGMNLAVWLPALFGIIAGSLGGLVRALTLKLGVQETLVTVLIGGIMAHYASGVSLGAFGWLFDYVTFSESEKIAFAKFVTGLCATVVIGAITDAFTAWRNLRVKLVSEGNDGRRSE